MPRPELIFLHSANGGGCNARELCKGSTLLQFEHDAPLAERDFPL
jgi:hypothetical protein